MLCSTASASASAPTSGAEGVACKEQQDSCGGVLFVRGTELLSESARSWSPRHQGREGERQKEVQEAKGDKERESAVNGEVGESHSTCA